MPVSLSSLVARFKALPPAQQALLGVGVPVVAGAALIGNVRGKATDSTEADAASKGDVGGISAPATIPFGAGLDDLFGLQSTIAKVETRLSARIDRLSGVAAAPGVGVGAAPAADSPPQLPPAKGAKKRPGPQVVDDSQFVKVASSTNTAAPTTRAIGRRPAVGVAEATSATVAASARRTATRIREQSPVARPPSRVPVAPRKVAPRTALKPLPRKVAPRTALKPLPSRPGKKFDKSPSKVKRAASRKVAPRTALKPPRINPRRRKVTGSRKVKLV